jgi:hypothetical protein
VVEARQPRAPAPRRALADGALAAIMLFTAVLAVHEVLNVPSSLPSRQAVFASADRPPPTWYDPFDYGDYSAPVVRPTLPGRIVLRPQLGDSYRYRLAPAASGTIATNVMGGPYLVRVRGAQHVGRTPEGFMVLRVDARAGERQEISFSPVRSVPRELAVAASLAALLASVLLIAGLAAHGARRRRAVPA